MNRAIRAELPPEVAAWLDTAAPDTWDVVGRELAVRLGRQLLDAEGWHERQVLLATTPSAALRAVLRQLPMRGRWGASTVATPLCAHLELFRAPDYVRRRLAAGESAQNAVGRAA